MNHFLWMHPWDLEGWEAEELLDEIASAGIAEIRLALAYHGGRLLLPRNRRHLVYELYGCCRRRLVPTLRQPPPF